MWIASGVFQHGYKLFSKDRYFNVILGMAQFGVQAIPFRAVNSREQDHKLLL